MPAWVPMANVFSVGDILIGVGAAIAVTAAMHGRGPLVERHPKPVEGARTNTSGGHPPPPDPVRGTDR